MLLQQALDIIPRHEEILCIELRLRIALSFFRNRLSHHSCNQFPTLEGLHDRGLIADNTPVGEYRANCGLPAWFHCLKPARFKGNPIRLTTRSASGCFCTTSLNACSPTRKLKGVVVCGSTCTERGSFSTSAFSCGNTTSIFTPLPKPSFSPAIPAFSKS